MRGCSTLPISSPRRWPATATPNRSTSKKTIPTFAIDWKGHYRIEGPAFVYIDGDTGRVTTILGYPTHKLIQKG